MSIHTDLIDRVMHLPASERAELARQLILSLEPPPTEADADVDAAWEMEIERRLAQVERGEVELLDWRESIRRARENLKKSKAG